MAASADEDAPFGPYLVYERLGVGGMATVHRALERGIEGFERIVALKRLLPHLAEDASFIKAFVREAKLASALNHVNIVQIFELGRVGTEYFISMEYIDGRDIRRILRHARKVTGPPPINVTVGLLLQLCDALDYAHNKSDENGVPMQLVHRDVSPSNVLVTSAGHVKVIDFGIAKAQSSQLRTQTGRVKGKLAYMAPEAISGKDLDARSDLFAIGVIAHELLTARPLFASKNEYQTLLKVQRGDIMPPSTFNQACHAELDAIVLRALARDPDQRYANAAELRDDLVALRKHYNLATNMRDIATWLEWAFNLEIPTGGFAGQTGDQPSISMDPRSPVRNRTPARVQAKQHRGGSDVDDAVEIAWGEDKSEQGPIVLDDVPDVSGKHLVPPLGDLSPGPAGSNPSLSNRLFDDEEIDDDIPTPAPSHGRAPSHRSTPGTTPLPQGSSPGLAPREKRTTAQGHQPPPNPTGRHAAQTSPEGNSLVDALYAANDAAATLDSMPAADTQPAMPALQPSRTGQMPIVRDPSRASGSNPSLPRTTLDPAASEPVIPRPRTRTSDVHSRVTADADLDATLDLLAPPRPPSAPPSRPTPSSPPPMPASRATPNPTTRANVPSTTPGIGALRDDAASTAPSMPRASSSGSMPATRDPASSSGSMPRASSSGSMPATRDPASSSGSMPAMRDPASSSGSMPAQRGESRASTSGSMAPVRESASSLPASRATPSPLARANPSVPPPSPASRPTPNPSVPPPTPASRATLNPLASRATPTPITAPGIGALRDDAPASRATPNPTSPPSMPASRASSSAIAPASRSTPNPSAPPAMPAPRASAPSPLARTPTPSPAETHAIHASTSAFDPMGDVDIDVDNTPPPGRDVFARRDMDDIHSRPTPNPGEVFARMPTPAAEDVFSRPTPNPAAVERPSSSATDAYSRATPDPADAPVRPTPDAAKAMPVVRFREPSVPPATERAPTELPVGAPLSQQVRTKPGHAPARAITALPVDEEVPTLAGGKKARAKAPSAGPTIGESMLREKAKGPRKSLVIIAGIVAAGAIATATTLYVTRGDQVKPVTEQSQPRVAPKTVGTVKFNLEPPDAEIVIGGQVAHTGSPFQVELEAGTHQVQINRAGYKSWLTALELSAAETQTLRVVLEPLGSAVSATEPEATLILSSTPTGLEAWLDGKVLPVKTPIKMPIKVGPHTIVLKNHGEEVWRQDLVAQANAEHEFSPSMDKIRERRATPTPARVAPARDSQLPKPSEPANEAPAPSPPPAQVAPAPAPSTATPPVASAAATTAAPTTPSVTTPAPPPAQKPAPTPAPNAIAKPAPTTAPTPTAPPAPPRIAGPVTIPPSKVTKLAGDVPELSKTRHAEIPPVVAAKLCIDHTGGVTSADLITKLEARAALEMVQTLKNWRYTPYKPQGSPTPSAACFAVSFRTK